MQFHTLGKRLPRGLDDGTTQPGKKSKKRKLDTADLSATAAEILEEPLQGSVSIPKILPGERLSDFAARVDQALPIAGLRGTDKQRAAKVPGLKERSTKHNKRLERMQREWREVERRRREKREEEVDELEDEREEQGMVWDGVGGNRKRRKGTGRSAEGGEDEDPWKALEKSRADAKQRNLQDVVQAPPQLTKVKRKFKEVGGGGGGGGGGDVVGVDVGNVPRSVGSLRKREEMGEARRMVIGRYRKRMGSEGGMVQMM